MMDPVRSCYHVFMLPFDTVDLFDHLQEPSIWPLNTQGPLIYLCNVQQLLISSKTLWDCWFTMCKSSLILCMQENGFLSAISQWVFSRTMEHRLTQSCISFRHEILPMSIQTHILTVNKPSLSRPDFPCHRLTFHSSLDWPISFYTPFDQFQGF